MISWLDRIRLRPLALVAAGLALVAVDFRTRTFDFLPDVAGWLLVAGAAHQLEVKSARALAVAAAALSLGELALPYQLVRINPDTSEVVPVDTPGAEGYPVHQRWDSLSSGRGGFIALAVVAGGVALVLLLAALMKRAENEGDGAVGRRLRVIQVVMLVVGCGPFVAMAGGAVLSSEGYDPVWNGWTELLGLAAAAALLVVGARLLGWRDRGWALPPGQMTLSPWALQRLAAGGDQPA